MLLPIVGIDLGTTFSAVAFVDSSGKPQIIPGPSGSLVTPSVICFNGREAWVGDKANARKETSPNDVYEFVKREIGKPLEVVQALFDVDASNNAAPFEVAGYKYGAAGMSAIILRYLKKQALRHYRRLELVTEADDTLVTLPAVITVPAYFGEKERRETRLAGFAAGLDVVGILNEPTAAALAFGLMRQRDQLILVFDLGGGTFDATVLQMQSGDAQVLATRGDSALGGRDWDEIIQRYLLKRARAQTGLDVDEAQGFEIQKVAIEAKHALSVNSHATVSFTHAGRDLDIELHRSLPTTQSFDEDLLQEECDEFYFEQRSASLLQHCRVLCESLIESVQIEGALGSSQLTWTDIGEVVLAGGSCKMPMIAEMLEKLTGLRIRRKIEGFNYDTAIAVGAALFGVHRERVQDVLSHGLGVKLIRGGREFIDQLLIRDSPIPRTVERSYGAADNAILEIWEGDSAEPDECILRGRLELSNKQGQVKIALSVDADGFLRVTADYPPQGREELEVRNEAFNFRGRATELRKRVHGIVIHV